MRAFAAVNLDETLRERLADAQRRLKQSGADVRWTGRQGLHITLKFLGDVAEDCIPAISGAIRGALDGCEPFRLRLQGAGSFPPRGAPRVIWVASGEGEGRLAEMAERLEDALEPLGFAREQRAFAAHVTLGRVKSPRERERLMEGVAALAGEEFGEMTVERAALMRSRLTPQGAIYSPVEEFPLARPG